MMPVASFLLSLLQDSALSSAMSEPIGESYEHQISVASAFADKVCNFFDAHGPCDGVKMKKGTMHARQDGVSPHSSLKSLRLFRTVVRCVCCKKMHPFVNCPCGYGTCLLLGVDLLK